MLEDRHYMRPARFESQRSVTLVLLVINTVAFVLQNVGYYYVRSVRVDDYFALSVEGLRHGFVWQLVTFQFMHSSLFHLLLNCFVIYMFGREIEVALGKKGFLALYFSSGVMGGLLQIGASLLLSDHFGGAVVGASAGAFGLVAAFAVLYPERPLTTLLFFIIPVTMRAKYLLAFSALLALFGIAFPGGHIAHAAHLGGMLTGIVFIRQITRWQWQWPRVKQAFRRRPAPRPLVNVRAGKSSAWGRPQPGTDEDVPTAEFLSKEVDPILDKISAQGIQSLTERERNILETARKKMGKR